MNNDKLRFLYADHLQIYVQVPAHAIALGVHLLSEAAKKVATWAQLNSLTLNASKTKAIVFGTAYTIRLFKSLEIPSLTINNAGHQAQFVNEVTSLGVVLVSNTQKASRGMIRHTLPGLLYVWCQRLYLNQIAVWVLWYFLNPV